MSLASVSHGKAFVRVAKVLREPSGYQTIFEYTVRIQLVGGTDASFTRADNSFVVATDTCKNHVYMLAKTHSCSSPELFALELSKVFLREYSHVRSVTIEIDQRPWERVKRGDVPHKHGFQVSGNGHPGCKLIHSRQSDVSGIKMISTLSSLSILKTTQSGWDNFYQDRFTTLPGTSERLLATTVDAQWTYTKTSYTDLMKIDYVKVLNKAREAFFSAFFGPPDKGEFSAGVQQTLYKMASSALQKVETLHDVTLSLPNLHFLPCNIPVFLKNNIRFEDDVYIPSNEPHGLITATVTRSNAQKNTSSSKQRLAKY